MNTGSYQKMQSTVPVNKVAKTLAGTCVGLTDGEIFALKDLTKHCSEQLQGHERVERVGNRLG